MRIELAEAMWVEERQDLDLDELSQVASLPREVLQELVDCGVISPSSTVPHWRFSGCCVNTARTASRLRNDFELDAGALAVVMKLMERIQDLEAEMGRLEAGGARHRRGHR